MPQTRHLLFATFVAALFPLLTHAATDKGVTVRGEAVSAGDIAALPPVCKLIMENPGIHHPTGQKRNAQLFERPEYQMAKGNIHLHHYCWALIAKQRYFRESQKGKRDFYFDRFLGDINYVFEHSPKSWGYFDVLHLELASMYAIRGDYATAINRADQALAARPGTEKAYVVKADAYKQMGKKERAVETALEGLKKNPQSKLLRSRLTKLGVKPPAPEELAAQAPAEQPPAEQSPADSAATAEADSTAPAAGETPPSDASPLTTSTPAASTPAAAPDSATSDAAATASQESTKPNPYCRFCP